MERGERAKLHGLMVRLADGDRAAFHPLFETLWPAVRSFTARMLSADADAEDAAQDTMVKVLSRARDFDRERDALTWALTLAAYESLTVRKRAARRSSMELPASIAAAAPTVEDEMIALEIESAAAAVLGELSPEDRAVILRSFDSRKGQREAVSATVRKRLQRALGRLRAAWGARHGVD